MRTLIAVALVLACGGSVGAGPDDVRVYPSPDDGAITEGETTIEADPDAAYAAAVDYGRWPSIFPDIVRVEITQQRGVDARVTLVHRAGNRDNVHFRNQPQARMIWFEDTGGRAEVWAEIVFMPGDRPGTTRIHSRLYADVPGIASLFVSDRKLRRLREERIGADLYQLRAYFARLAADVASARR